MLQKIKNWLAKQRHFFFSWYTKNSQEAQEVERSLVELPATLKEELVNRVQHLPNNPADREAIAATLNKAFALWQNNPNNANNSLVILSSPVTTVSRIVSEFLQEWSQQKQVAIKILPLTARPTEVATIKAKLEHYLQDKTKHEDYEAEKREVLVIPNLNWCFLRSLEGLEGIEYLQSLLGEHFQHRFWVIGASQVGWEYLNSVCNIAAYCGEVFPLSEIAPEDLQKWLNPIIEGLNIAFDKPRIERQLLDDDPDNQITYFKRLADIAQGDSTVAIQGFLQSICYPETDENEDKEEQKSPPKPLAKTPKLPDLPTIDSPEQYILYSLLLHGDLTISALAESLGDEAAEVEPKVQVLRRKGIIEQQNKILKINPIHYPKLKQKLASNNFIISEN